MHSKAKFCTATREVEKRTIDPLLSTSQVASVVQALTWNVTGHIPFLLKQWMRIMM